MIDPEKLARAYEAAESAARSRLRVDLVAHDVEATHPFLVDEKKVLARREQKLREAVAELGGKLDRRQLLVQIAEVARLETHEDGVVALAVALLLEAAS